MEQHRLRLAAHERRRRVGGERREERLERVVEHELVALPRVHGPGLNRHVERRDFQVARRGPGVQLQVVA